MTMDPDLAYQQLEQERDTAIARAEAAEKRIASWESLRDSDKVSVALHVAHRAEDAAKARADTAQAELARLREGVESVARKLRFRGDGNRPTTPQGSSYDDAADMVETLLLSPSPVAEQGAGEAGPRFQVTEAERDAAIARAEAAEARVRELEGIRQWAQESADMYLKDLSAANGMAHDARAELSALRAGVEHIADDCVPATAFEVRGALRALLSPSPVAEQGATIDLPLSGWTVIPIDDGDTGYEQKYAKRAAVTREELAKSIESDWADAAVGGGSTRTPAEVAADAAAAKLGVTLAEARAKRPGVGAHNHRWNGDPNSHRAGLCEDCDEPYPGDAAPEPAAAKGESIEERVARLESDYRTLAGTLRSAMKEHGGYSELVMAAVEAKLAAKGTRDV